MTAVVGPLSDWQFFAVMVAGSVAGLAYIAWPWNYRAPEPLPSAAEILAKRRAERAAAGHRPDTYRQPMPLVWPGDEAPDGEALYSRWSDTPEPFAEWWTGGPMPDDMAAFASKLAVGLDRNDLDRAPGWLRVLEARHSGEHQAVGEAA